jgi:hypothetical protein
MRRTRQRRRRLKTQGDQPRRPQISAMSWSLARPQSQRKSTWRSLQCVSSGLAVVNRIGLRQSGQTGDRTGGGGSGWCISGMVRPLRRRK